MQSGKFVSLGATVRDDRARGWAAGSTVVTDGADSYLGEHTYARRDGYPYSTSIDLGRPTAISEIDVTPITEASSMQTTYKYVLEASRDGKSWTTLHDGRNNTTIQFLIHQQIRTNTDMYVSP